MRKRTSIVAVLLLLSLFGLLFFFVPSAEYSAPMLDQGEMAERPVMRVVERKAPQPGEKSKPVREVEIVAGDRKDGSGPAPKRRARPAPMAQSTDDVSAVLKSSTGLVDRFESGRRDRSAKRSAKRTTVIQEKRQIRARKKPRKKVKEQKSIEVVARDRSPSKPRLTRMPDLDAFRHGDVIVESLEDHEPAPIVPEPELVRSTTEMTLTADDPKSTFSIDVDTGSYTLARARMRQGYPPKTADVRVEEFLNYFHYDYPAPHNGEFSVHLEAAPDPLADPSTASRRHLVRIGVQGKTVAAEARPPAHLTFLVDVSGSMFGPDQLGLVIESLDLVTRNLRPDDTIAIVTFARKAEVKLWPAGATERDLVSRAIASLEPGGSSALNAGLQLAYQVAAAHFHAGHINRVVLLGDGRVNVGERRPERLLQSVRHGVEDGVELSTIGFGAKSFNDALMEQLANRGNGAYYFVDSYREAQKVFGDQLCGTLFTIAKDVKIQVEFNPGSVVRHRLVGYENRRLEHHEFRDDAVDAGEIGAGHSVTAIYEVDLAEQPESTIASVNIRYKQPDEQKASELNFQLFTEELIDDVRNASPDFKFAAAVALFAQIVRGDKPKSADRLSLVREIANEGLTRADEQPDRLEFVALLEEVAPFYAN